MMDVETEHLFETYRFSGNRALFDYQDLLPEPADAKQKRMPIILGDEGDVVYLIEHLEAVLDERLEDGFEGDDKTLLAQGIPAVLTKAEVIHLPDWFKHRLGELAYEATYSEQDWPDLFSSEPDELTAIFNALDGEFKPEILVGLVPVEQAYEIPAYFGFGNWSSCPAVEEHVAVLKHWQQKYGARLTCMTGSVLELTVSKPPLKREDAFELAKEQMAYCPDIVTQGTESPEDLAALLQGKRHWFFRWD